jgi:hypothetical protein
VRRSGLLLLVLGTVLAPGVRAAPVVELVEKPAPLVAAARSRDGPALAALLAKSHADVNERSADGTTALHWAVYNNDVELVAGCWPPVPRSRRPTTITPRRFRKPQ